MTSNTIFGASATQQGKSGCSGGYFVLFLLVLSNILFTHINAFSCARTTWRYHDEGSNEVRRAECLSVLFRLFSSFFLTRTHIQSCMHRCKSTEKRGSRVCSRKNRARRTDGGELRLIVCCFCRRLLTKMFRCIPRDRRIAALRRRTRTSPLQDASTSLMRRTRASASMSGRRSRTPAKSVCHVSISSCFRYYRTRRAHSTF